MTEPENSSIRRSKVGEQRKSTAGSGFNWMSVGSQSRKKTRPMYRSWSPPIRQSGNVRGRAYFEQELRKGGHPDI